MEPNFRLVETGTFKNIFIGDEMVASYDESRGEFCVYDPQSESEEPVNVVRES